MEMPVFQMIFYKGTGNKIDHPLSVLNSYLPLKAKKGDYHELVE